MRMLPCIIALMCLFQVSIYAQESAQVTLSIRLYPIQTIEVVPTAFQTVEVSDQDLVSHSKQTQSSTHSKKLSAFSTSQFSTQVDSLSSIAFKELHSSSAVPPRDSRSINRIIADERYDYDTHGDDLHVMYSMETL